MHLIHTHDESVFDINDVYGSCELAFETSYHMDSWTTVEIAVWMTSDESDSDAQATVYVVMTFLKRPDEAVLTTEKERAGITMLIDDAVPNYVLLAGTHPRRLELLMDIMELPSVVQVSACNTAMLRALNRCVYALREEQIAEEQSDEHE
jgi:hypothetical protein